MKPENRFISQVHKHLPELVYREKTNNPYRGGTPDVYYEGSRDILWVEYKFKQSLPKTVKLKLTKLQLRWLHRCYGNGKNCWVILGWKDNNTTRGVIFTDPSDWERAHDRNSLMDRSLSIQELARWITGETTWLYN